MDNQKLLEPDLRDEIICQETKERAYIELKTNFDKLNQWLALGANTGVLIGIIVVAVQFDMA